MISKPQWDKHRPESNPFLNYEFMDALIKSQCVKTETGWTPAFLENDHGILLSFNKTHNILRINQRDIWLMHKNLKNHMK